MRGIVPFAVGRAAEHGVGRKGEGAQKQHQREDDAEQDAFHQAQHHHAGQRHQRAGQTDAAEAPEPRELAEIAQAPGRRHQHAAECGDRQIMQQAGEPQHRRHDHRGCDDRSHLGASARGLGDGGARVAGADGQPLAHARHQVGHSESDQFLVGVDALAAAGREGTGRDDRVGEGQKCGDQRHRQQQVEIGQRQRGECQAGQPGWNASDDRHPLHVEAQQPDGQAGGEECHHGARHARREPAAEQDQHEASRADRKRHAVGAPASCRPGT